jgi:hypothetical protein
MWANNYISHYKPRRSRYSRLYVSLYTCAAIGGLLVLYGLL